VRRIDLVSATKWDELEMLRAEAGKVFGEPSDENWANYHRLSNSVPSIESVEIVTGQGCFSVTPAPEQAQNQLAYGVLYRITTGLGWRISNKLIERLDPILALNLGRRYGAARLRYRSSWRKVTMPSKLHVKDAQQEHPQSVHHMIEAPERQERFISLSAYRSLSARSIARTLPPGEAEQYLEAVGER
jgi:hypothetical protein